MPTDPLQKLRIPNAALHRAGADQSVHEHQARRQAPQGLPRKPIPEVIFRLTRQQRLPPVRRRQPTPHVLRANQYSPDPKNWQIEAPTLPYASNPERSYVQITSQFGPRKTAIGPTKYDVPDPKNVQNRQLSRKT